MKVCNQRIDHIEGKAGCNEEFGVPFSRSNGTVCIDGGLKGPYDRGANGDDPAAFLLRLRNKFCGFRFNPVEFFSQDMLSDVRCPNGSECRCPS